MKKRKTAKNGTMTLDKLARMMGRGFAGIDKRFETINKRFESVDKQFLGMNDRFDIVDARFAVLEVDMKEVMVRLDKIEENIANLTNTLDAFLKRLTAHEEEFDIMKHEMKLVKKALKEKLHIDIEARGFR